jgi:hypothetical protein
MTVRLFGGWGFEAADVQRPDLANFGYEHGVPMGAELTPRSGARAPRLMVSAMKDPLGANLDRVQIIKGWIDGAGNTQEKVYNVAVSNGRVIRENQVGPVGNTVDVKAASYRNSIGAAQLATVWEDPDFDPEQPVFYYARVIEIPTPRWTSYDAAFFGETAPADAPAITRERAYTSPIWYTPVVP